MKIKFCDLNSVSDDLLKFAVISTMFNNKWVFVKHRDRSTWEIPGGHREVNENITQAAKRELFEETGAIEYDITPICIYGVEHNNETSYGQLFFCNVKNFSNELNFEIKEKEFFSEIPSDLTYPLIQPYLQKRVIDYLKSINSNFL